MRQPAPPRAALAALPSPVRFVLAGGVAAVVNFGARIGLSLALPFTVAIVLAYLCGMATAFVLNRHYVFQASVTRLHEQLLWFTVVNAFALAQTVAISLLLARIALPRAGINWHVEELAHAVGIVVPIFTSYIGHRQLTFR